MSSKLIESLIRELEKFITVIHRKGAISGDEKIRMLHVTTQIRMLYKREREVKKDVD